MTTPAPLAKLSKRDRADAVARALEALGVQTVFATGGIVMILPPGLAVTEIGSNEWALTASGFVLHRLPASATAGELAEHVAAALTSLD